MPRTPNKMKDQMLGIALLAGVYACITLNRHMRDCAESSKNVKRALWIVLSAVVGELVLKGFSMIHLG